MFIIRVMLSGLQFPDVGCGSGCVSPSDFRQTCDKPVLYPRLLQTVDLDEDTDINDRRPGPQSCFERKVLEVLRDKL